MRIIVCNWKDLTHPNAGGAEVYTELIARRWAAWGHDVTLLCASVDGQPERQDVEGVHVIRKGSRFGVYGATAEHLRRHAHEADVVLDEINTRPFHAMRHAASTPVVALIHQLAREVWFHEMPLPVALAGRYVLEPHWLRAYRDVPTLTVSQSSADSLRAYGLENLAVVPEGVELPDDTQADLAEHYRSGAKRAEPTLVFCGRLVSMKRPDHAVEAFRLARRSFPGLELHLIGSGPLEAKLRRAKVPGVVLHGRVSQRDKFRLLMRSHAMLATSVREGWGLVVSEAAAVGTPTIGYDVAGTRDSVTAADGVLTDPNPDALAAAIVEHLPSMMAAPPSPLPHGGAQSWDDVARTVLVHLERAVGRDRGRSVPTARGSEPLDAAIATTVDLTLPSVGSPGGDVPDTAAASSGSRLNAGSYTVARSEPRRTQTGRSIGTS